MEKRIKGKKEDKSLSKRFLFILGGLLILLLVSWAIYEYNQAPGLNTLDPNNYKDNPELMNFASSLIDRDKESAYDALAGMKELDYSAAIRNDPRFIEILVKCLYEKETIPEKLQRFIKNVKDYFAFEDLSSFVFLWEEFIYVFEYDEEMNIRDMALAYLADLEEKANPAVPEICRLLEEDSQMEIKYVALYALEMIKSPEAFPYLIKAADDEELAEPDIASALINCARNKEQVREIVKLLDSKDDRRRLLGVYALYYFEYYDDEFAEEIYGRAVDLLMNDPFPDVRKESVFILNSLDKSDKTGEIILRALKKEEDYYVRLSLIEGLAYHKAAADFLTETAEAVNESEITLAAVASLGTILKSNKELEKEISELFVSMVKSPFTQDPVKEECLRILASVDSDGTRELIIERIKRNYEKKVFSNDEVNKLVNIGNEKSRAFLFKVLNDQCITENRFLTVSDLQYLIRQLGDMNSVETDKKLKEIFNKKELDDKSIKKALLIELASNGDEEAVGQILNEAKKMKEDYYRWELLKTIKKSKSPALTEHLAQILKDRKNSRDYTTIFSGFYLDPKLYETIRDIVYDKNLDAPIRCNAITGLRNTGDPRAEKEIRDIMNDENSDIMIRLIAGDELTQFGNEDSFEFIEKCLAHSDLNVRRNALDTLWSFDEKKVIPVLEKRLRVEKDYTLRKKIKIMMIDIRNQLLLDDL